MVFIRRSNSNIVGESRLAAQLPKGGDIGLCWAAGLEIDFLPQNRSPKKKKAVRFLCPHQLLYMDGWMMGLPLTMFCLMNSEWAAGIKKLRPS